MILQSEFPLPSCPSTTDRRAPDIRIRMGSGIGPSPGQPVFAWPGRYGLALFRHPDGWLMTTRDQGAMVVADNGGEIRCYPRGTSNQWTDVLLRRVLPRVMQSRGRLLLHAACASDGAKGYLLFGRSRMGKSTLTAALALSRSWEVLTDDQIILDPSTRPPLCHPCGFSVCLWPDSARGLGLSLESMRRVAGHEDKRWHPGAPPPSVASRPLGALIFLTDRDSRGRVVDNVEAWSLPPAEAARYAHSSLMFFDPTDEGARARAWAELGALVGAAPSFALAYPRVYSALPAVTDAIASLAGAAA